MAVFRAPAQPRNTYYGLAADARPNASDPNLTVGDIYWATDTGVQEVWNGSAWVERAVPANSA